MASQKSATKRRNEFTRDWIRGSENNAEKVRKLEAQSLDENDPRGLNVTPLEISLAYWHGGPTHFSVSRVGSQYEHQLITSRGARFITTTEYPLSYIKPITKY